MASFGLRYYAELRSKHKEVFWRVEIAERGFSGKSEEMAFDGGSPLSITWEKRGDEFFIPVKASEATINILCQRNFHYMNLFTSDPRKFRVSVYRNTKLYWRGYVVADLYSENFTAPPYQVSIKAVDGFNLLSSIPFKNLDNTPITGRKSVWELVASCIDLLELEVNVADWMDLYAEGMNEGISPLRQVYIDMERFYAVYSDPTYRDVLELCLRPFAGQIFQSNGALHIRRTVSLYNDTRPMSFYSVGKEFPVGWIIAADRRNLETHTGAPIITESTRERIESMWENDINVQGESVMDIVPAIRKVSVGVKNKMMTNIISQMGLYNMDNWYDPEEFLVLQDEKTLRFTGDSDRQGWVINFKGYPVQQCSYTLTLEYTLKIGIGRYSSLGSGRPADVELIVEYGFKLVGASVTYWLMDDGTWTSREEFLEDKIKLSVDVNKKIEVKGFPMSGQFVMVIKQNLKGYSSGRNAYFESLYISDIKMEIDTGDDYENSLKYEVFSNPANNVDMSVSLPIADIPNIPNDQLIYSLYFTDYNGKPTRMWRSKGGNDYNSLVNHIVACALRYKQLPGKRIGGEMFTGKHIDMNTVVQDDKYLRSGFYVNSIELNCLQDSYNSELVEMSGLLRKEFPPAGDDCLKLCDLPFTVTKSIRCINQLVMLSTDNSIYTYDSVSGYITRLFSFSKSVQIFPADNAFTIVDGSSIRVVDYRGVVIRQLNREYSDVATFMNKYIYIIASYGGRVITKGLSRPEYKYTYTTYRRGYGFDYTTIAGTITGIEKSFSTIAINTTTKAYLHDCRVNMDLLMTGLEDGAEVKSISDYFICQNSTAQFKIYRRNSLLDSTMVKSYSDRADFTDHTLGEVAFSQNGSVKVWTYRTNTTRIVKNLAGNSSTIKGLYYINGELYILRDKSLFKYIP